MSALTSVRVFSPFENRVVAATPSQAKILRQLRRTMDVYTAAAPERIRLAQRQWKQRAKSSLLGELEILDSTVAGAASWCTRSGGHPDPQAAIKQMSSFDLQALHKKLRTFPRLQEYLDAIAKLRDLVVAFLEIE